MAHSSLFDPARHVALSDRDWDEDIVRATVHGIIDDILGKIQTDGSWPTHPLDAESYPDQGPKWAMYAGASGVVLALQILHRYGYLQQSFPPHLPNLLEHYRQSPDVNWEPGLQLGELGILALADLAHNEADETHNRLVECMQSTLSLPYYEITSGQTGMMHLALFLFRKTGQDVWKHMFLRGASTLLENWKLDSTSGQWHWQSEVFGKKRQYYGACHGIAGNGNILLQGADLLGKETSRSVLERSVSALALSAQIEGDKVNWPLYTGPKSQKLLVQWCHGAAGIVTAMAGYPKGETEPQRKLDELLLKAGNLVWAAGPVRKGPGICHGTAGNGYAFLYLYQRFNNPIWLFRARKFAMDAIVQSRAAQREFGQGRYSLWTGDAGLAVFLHHCLCPEDTGLPGLDLF